jgi:hypothetical protein
MLSLSNVTDDPGGLCANGRQHAAGSAAGSGKSLPQPPPSAGAYVERIRVNLH